MTRCLLAEDVFRRLRFPGSSTSRSANRLAYYLRKRLRDLTSDYVPPLTNRELSLSSLPRLPASCVRVPQCISLRRAPHRANESACIRRPAKLTCLTDARSVADCSWTSRSCQARSRTRQEKFSRAPGWAEVRLHRMPEKRHVRVARKSGSSGPPSPALPPAHRAVAMRYSVRTRSTRTSAAEACIMAKDAAWISLAGSTLAQTRAPTAV